MAIKEHPLGSAGLKAGSPQRKGGEENPGRDNTTQDLDTPGVDSNRWDEPDSRSAAEVSAKYATCPRRRTHTLGGRHSLGVGEHTAVRAREDGS